MKKNVFVLVSCLLAVQANAQTKLSLAECRQMAMDRNKSIAIADESIKAATELKKAAFTQFLPNFAANGTYMWNQKDVSLLSEDKHLPVVNYNADGTKNIPSSVNNKWAPANGTYVPLDASGAPFDPNKNPEKLQWKSTALLPKSELEFDMQNVFAGSIGFTQPIFMGGKIKEFYNLAKYGENLAVANKESKSYELMQEVDEAYWRVISVQNKHALALDYRNLLAQMEKDIAIMIETGVATKSEALKVKVKLNEAEVMLMKAENGLNLSCMALNQLIGLELETKISLADTGLDDTTEKVELVEAEPTIDNRPEIKALTQMQNISKANEKIMFSRFLPTVALAGNYVVTNPNVYNGYENKFGGMFNVSVVAHVPIFHFGEKIHTLNTAKAQHRISGLKLDEAREKIQLQVKQNSYKLIESVKQRTATQSNMENAKENLQMATDGFAEGMITSTDLLSAQTAWLSAKSEDIDAAINVKLTNLYLQKALGKMEIPQATALSTKKKN